MEKLWDYVILETIRKYPRSADINLIEKALDWAGDPNKRGEHRPFLEEDLVLFAERGWCNIGSPYYSITNLGMTHLSDIATNPSYDKHYKYTVSDSKDVVIGDVAIGAFSALIQSLAYINAPPEQFDIIVTTLVIHENFFIFSICDLLEYGPFEKYYGEVTQKDLPNLKIRTEGVQKEYDERLVGALLMLDILLALSPINMVPCARLLPLYFRYHKISYNPLTMTSIRNQRAYKSRREPLMYRLNKAMDALENDTCSRDSVKK
jgi:hypothetical protein